MSNHICLAQDTIKELGEGWSVDLPRSEKSCGAYMNGPNGVCVYLTTPGYGAQKDRIKLSDGANWRDSKGRYCVPYDYKGVTAGADPKTGAVGVAKRIRAKLADFDAACKLARDTVGKENDYAAATMAVGEALQAMPHSSRAHGDNKGVVISVHTEPDSMIYGHAYATGRDTCELELRCLTPEQAIAAMRAVLALVNVRKD